MKKKLLVLLIAVIPTLMPNLVFAIAIDVGDRTWDVPRDCNARLERCDVEKEITSTTNCCYSLINAELGICDCD